MSHFLYNLGTAYAVLLTASALTLAQYALCDAVERSVGAYRQWRTR